MMKSRVLSGLPLLSLTAALVACSDSSDEASTSEALENRVELNLLASSSTRVFNDDLKKQAAEFEPPVGLFINNAEIGRASCRERWCYLEYDEHLKNNRQKM